MSAPCHDNPNGKDTVQSQGLCRRFFLAEMQRATNNFDDALVLGVGGFGKVYKGLIDDGATTVAVKRLNAQSNQGAQEFWTEVKMLSELRHPHLVALIGYCNDGDEMILVYEFVANGTLAHHLHKISTNADGFRLSWERRLQICIGAARGLDFLHSGTNQSFVHRDVKTTNILLDENWGAKISDFGLSKGTTSHSITHFTTEVKGTFGYLDRDYFLTHRLTKKSDVYAFGVVMLEVLCGRPPVDPRLDEEQISLVSWVGQCIRKGRIDEAIDQCLRGEISPQSLKFFVEVSTRCLLDCSQERPTMAQVVASMEQALALQRQGMLEIRHDQLPSSRESRRDKLPPPRKKKGHGLSFVKQIEGSLMSALESFRSGLSRNGEFRAGLPPQVYPTSYNYAMVGHGNFNSRAGTSRSSDGNTSHFTTK